MTKATATTQEIISASPAKPEQSRKKESLFTIGMQAVRATLVIGLLTGLAFPLAITGIGQALFPSQANGSIVKNDKGEPIGSLIIAQKFENAKYFHSRPSAAGSGYAGEASGGTNLGPTSKKLFEGILDDPQTKDVNESFDGVKQLAQNYRKENNLAADYLVPVDAVTRSGSGMDPDISPENARVQAARVARVRNLPLQVVMDTVDKHTEARQFGILGEPHVNVLAVNLALDKKNE